MEKATIYARVSTKEQAEEGYSLASQLKVLREYATQHQLELVKEFVIPESASGRQKRTTFKEMMEYCKKRKVDHILCEKVDRITRNLQYAVWIDGWLQGDAVRRVHFVKQNLVIHQNAKSYEKFQWDIYVVLARQYSNNLSEETKKGLIEKAQEGWYPGSAKRGYVSIGERGHKVWQIDQSNGSEAPFIRRAFEMYGAGNHTLATIRDALFAQGWISGAGKKIPKGTLHVILRDPFYCGRFIWNGQEYEGKHEPLIEEERYEMVQRRLRRVLKNGKTRKHSFMYAGIFRCAGCEGSVCAELQKGHVYYRCSRYRPCTQKKATREENITRQVLDALGVLKVHWPTVLETLSSTLRQCHAAETAYHERLMREFDKRLKQAKARIDLLYDDRADSRISKEFFDQKLAQYEQQQNMVIREIGRHKDRSIGYAKTASDLLDISQKAKELFWQLEPEDKRALLRFILTEPRLDKGQVILSYKKPFDKIHEIAAFQPQKSEMEQREIERLIPFRPDVLGQQDHFPDKLSIDRHAKFLREFLGVMEFPLTTSETAARFAAMELYEESSVPMAA